MWTQPRGPLTPHPPLHRLSAPRSSLSGRGPTTCSSPRLRVVVGYLKLSQSIALPSHDHVLRLNGLAVDPQRQRHGAGRRLVEAAMEEAQGRGAHKLSLRVLGSNTSARLLYEACGFAVEGILGAEFLLNGRYVDDVLMARQLAPEQ